MVLPNGLSNVSMQINTSLSIVVTCARPQLEESRVRPHPHLIRIRGIQLLLLKLS